MEHQMRPESGQTTNKLIPSIYLLNNLAIKTRYLDTRYYIYLV